MWAIYALLGLGAVAFTVMCFTTKKLAWIVLAGLSVTTIINIAMDTPWWVYIVSVVIAVGLIVALYSVPRKARAIVVVTTIIVAAIYVVSFALPDLNLVHKPGAPNGETVKVLTVLQPDKFCGNTNLKVAALEPSKKVRVRSTAVSTPFKPANIATPNNLFGEVAAAVCTDPLYGAQVLNYFAMMRIGSFELASVNSWLDQFKGTDVTTINTVAAKYMELQGKKKLTSAEVKKRNGLEIEWRAWASMALTLLSKFTVGTVQTDRSVLNYQLFTAEKNEIQGLPAVSLSNTQVARPALQLILVQQGSENQCLARIGFSTDDKSLAEYACPVAR